MKGLTNNTQARYMNVHSIEPALRAGMGSYLYGYQLSPHIHPTHPRAPSQTNTTHKATRRVHVYPYTCLNISLWNTAVFTVHLGTRDSRNEVNVGRRGRRVTGWEGATWGTLLDVASTISGSCSGHHLWLTNCSCQSTRFMYMYVRVNAPLRIAWRIARDSHFG